MRRVPTPGDRTSEPTTTQQALQCLAELGASPALLTHHRLVLAAAQELVAGLADHAAYFDAQQVLLGACVHDAGKIRHPHEMHGPGAQHEPAGEAMLRAHGLGPLARFCITHARWRDMPVQLEDLLVALADTLWKGARNDELERRVISELATSSGGVFWDLYVPLDDLFERVAAEGPARLHTSRGGG